MFNPVSCRFAKTHEWTTLKEGAAVVGISDHAQSEITDVVFVELPRVGRKVKQGETVSVVESVKAAFDIYAPVSGEVVAVNDKVAKDPAVVNRSPHDEGWLFKIAPAAPDEMNSLMDYKQYQEFLGAAAAHG